MIWQLTSVFEADVFTLIVLTMWKKIVKPSLKRMQIAHRRCGLSSKNQVSYLPTSLVTQIK